MVLVNRCFGVRDVSERRPCRDGGKPQPACSGYETRCVVCGHVIEFIVPGQDAIPSDVDQPGVDLEVPPVEYSPLRRLAAADLLVFNRPSCRAVKASVLRCLPVWVVAGGVGVACPCAVCDQVFVSRGDHSISCSFRAAPTTEWTFSGVVISRPLPSSLNAIAVNSIVRIVRKSQILGMHHSCTYRPNRRLYTVFPSCGRYRRGTCDSLQCTYAYNIRRR